MHDERAPRVGELDRLLPASEAFNFLGQDVELTLELLQIDVILLLAFGRSLGSGWFAGL